MRFSAGEAAFEGFRVTRQHPAALLGWSLVWLLSVVATILTALPILQPVMGELQALLQSIATGAQAEPSLAIQTRMAYATWATLPISVVTQAVFMPALYRAMASEGRDRFAFLRLSRVELRVLGVLTALSLISLVLSQIGDTAATVFQGTSFSVLGGMISFAATLAGVVVAVRLVLATPQTFETGHIDLKAAWRLTTRMFWPLFGLAIMAGVMACVVVLLLTIMALPLSGLAAGAQAGSTLAGIAMAGLLLLVSLGSALVMTIVAAPFMAVYREVTGAKSATRG
jgi:hypothetical protein